MNQLRAWANKKFVDLKIWSARRKAYKDRTLVVSNHWDGSVQVFYHFLLGYFAPLSIWIRKSGSKRIAVRDCGPMNTWFDFLFRDVDVQIVKPGMALHSYVGRRTRCHVVKGLDYPTKHGKSKLQTARNSMLHFIPEMDVAGNPILVIDRATSDEYHSGSLSETEMSGARRRSVPNLNQVCADLFVPGSYLVADMAQITPAEQVAIARPAKILIGQHGAGLTHMIWMPQGSTIIEIHPPLPDEAIDVFLLLARALGHNYIRIPQEHVHANVHSQSLKEVVNSFAPEYLR